MAAQRYRFQALKRRGEVVLWTVGESAPSGTFTECAIKDGRNWSCKPNVEAVPAVAHEMVHGRPVLDRDESARSSRMVTKWSWLMLRYGISSHVNPVSPKPTPV